MKLTELDPVLISVKKRPGVGIRFQCPLCKDTQIAVLFLNALDGFPSVPDDKEACGNNGGKRWSRSGLTFEDMSLHPSIDATTKRGSYPEGAEGDVQFAAANRPCTEGGSNHWHGYLLHGEIS